MGGEEKRQVRKDAEGYGLSRKTLGDNQEFHVGLVKLPERPSNVQDTYAGNA